MMKITCKFAQFFLAIAFFTLVGSSTIFAQKVSLIANFNAFDNEQVTSANGTNVSNTGETSFTGNLRLFSNRRWAFRAGVGVNELSYTLSEGGLNTNYDVVKESMTALVGVEKHFKIGRFSPYLGANIPFTFDGTQTTTDIAGNLIDQVESGDVRAGLSLVGGLNMRIFKILSIGVEFDAGFDHFKEQVVDHVLEGNVSQVAFNNLERNTAFTIGITF
ncbi:MAG: hypothetical protein ACPGXL_06505 [Chitinophagales bacterium]